MQRATNCSSSAQQSQSMSVSQSPDSVIASDDINVVNTNNNLNNNTVANPVVNQQQPTRVSLSPTNNTRAPPSTSSQQQPPNRNTVVNPYLKQCPKNNNNTTHTIIDPILKKKQEFVDRYHLQALQHRGRNRVGGDSAKSISALELHANTQNWRHSWQQRQQLPCANDQALSNHTIPLRPRLFLFRRHAEQQKQNTNGMHQQQQQRQQPEGIWELDTGITELSGEGGSGKTQICLSTCVTCVMTPLLYPTPLCGNGNSAPNTTIAMNNVSSIQSNLQQNINHYTSIYITMGEGIPPASIARRLEQMVRTRLNNQMGNYNTSVDDIDNQVKDILSRIGLLSIRNEEEFVEFVEVDLPRILAQQKQQKQQHHQSNNPYLRQQHHQQQTTQTTKIGLIAFDGIAGFFRFSDPTYQHSRNSMFHFQRSSKLLQISSQLRKLSNVFDVPILITNQVTASIPPVVARGNGSNSFDMVSASMLATSSGGGYQRTLPALGLIWSNCVSTRFILQRKDGTTFSLDDNVGNAEQQQNVQQSVAGGEKSQKQTMKKKRAVRLRKARILQAVNMEKEEQEVWYVIDTGEVLAVR